MDHLNLFNHVKPLSQHMPYEFDVESRSCAMFGIYNVSLWIYLIQFKLDNLNCIYSILQTGGAKIFSVDEEKVPAELSRALPFNKIV